MFVCVVPTGLIRLLPKWTVFTVMVRGRVADNVIWAREWSIGSRVVIWHVVITPVAEQQWQMLTIWPPLGDLYIRL